MTDADLDALLAAAGHLVADVREGVIFTRSGLLAIGAVVGAGIVGALDDWIKVSRERNLGLTKGAKMGGLLAVAVAFAVLAAAVACHNGMATFADAGVAEKH